MKRKYILLVATVMTCIIISGCSEEKNNEETLQQMTQDIIKEDMQESRTEDIESVDETYNDIYSSADKENDITIESTQNMEYAEDNKEADVTSGETVQIPVYERHHSSGEWHGIESIFDLEEIDRVKREYGDILDKLEIPDNMIYTSLYADEDENGDICLVYTGVDEDINYYGSIIRYSDDKTGKPSIREKKISSIIKDGIITALYYNNGICVIGTDNGVGNNDGKVTIYRHYSGNGSLRTYSIDCSEYDIADGGTSYVSDIFIEDGITKCKIVLADGDEVIEKLPFVGETMKTSDEYVAAILDISDKINDDTWDNTISAYNVDVDGDGIVERVVCDMNSCCGIVRLDDYSTIYTRLSSGIRLDDYISDISCIEGEPAKATQSSAVEFVNNTYRLIDVHGNSFEIKYSIPSFYGEFKEAGLNINFVLKYDALDGRFSYDGSIVAVHGDSNNHFPLCDVKIFLEPDIKNRCLVLSGEYVIGQIDTRNMPDEKINLSDCEIMTGKREEIVKFIGTSNKFNSYDDWEMFAIYIDNHWRVGYYKDGVAVIIYYNSGPYGIAVSSGILISEKTYNLKVCMVAQTKKVYDTLAKEPDIKEGKIAFERYQVENMWLDLKDDGVMKLEDVDGDGKEELLVGYNIISGIPAAGVEWNNKIKIE